MMSDYCWLNGRVVEAAQARISPFDRGFLYGDGLFETMRFERGGVHLFARHLQRLADSASRMRIPMPAESEIREAVEALVDAAGVDSAVIRLTVSRGSGGTALQASTAVSPTMFITLRALPSAGRPYGLVSVDTMVTPSPVGPRMKSLSYISSIHAGLQLPDKPYVEALMYTPEGWAVEGAVSNLFCVIEGRLHTAPLKLGVLPGIARARVLELASVLEIEATETPFTRQQLIAADECFITNSVRGVVPVVDLDNAVIGGGSPGEKTMALHRAFEAEVPMEDPSSPPGL